MPIATDRAMNGCESLRRKPLNRRKLRYLYVVFIKCIENAFLADTLKRSEENYMIDVLEYDMQGGRCSYGFFIMAAISYWDMKTRICLMSTTDCTASRTRVFE